MLRLYNETISSRLRYASGRYSGGVAEWLGTGLQNRSPRFNSGRRLHLGIPRGLYSAALRAHSSGVERYLDTVEVRGSNPRAPT